MAGLRPSELLIILLVVLLLFGPNRLPELGSSLGRALRNLRAAVNAPDKTQNEKVEDERLKG